jgi:hypothetical protein
MPNLARIFRGPIEKTQEILTRRQACARPPAAQNVTIVVPEPAAGFF